MQNLQFEKAWDRTLSAKDRKRIKEIFSETKSISEHSVYFSTLWQAKNYKGELLITVLIHNFRQQLLSFCETPIRYVEGTTIIAEHIFTIPSLRIEPTTSMPWTFIFPKESIICETSLMNGHLQFMYEKL
ncbi:hypothetical protein NG54_09300 [Heyndrickxia ginsengihumi]|uniref:SLAP domain-containing protein n=1 Tax=Heyndrickxia ginsengihumi TaxID=363870 RepID=A0A0A6VFR1_9BACI|nr:SLAP domain-containing protein [Heyndrickxia ginsengihumi]KHD85459.1 hypothetical protein NG54_09300 [Heyndrickxia ginsengihumi]